MRWSTGNEASELRHRVCAPAQATAEFLHGQKPHGGAFVIGEDGLLNALNYGLVGLARRRLGLRTGEVTMTGDTMETDIRGATDPVFRSILVLTGSTTLDTLREFPYSPPRWRHLSRNSRPKRPGFVIAHTFVNGTS